MDLLDRYFLGKILPVMVLTLMVAMVIFMLDKLLTLLNITIGNGVSALIAIKMMFTLMPYYLRLVLPLGLFLGVIFTFRGLSINSEFHVMQSAGVSLLRMVRSAIVCSVIGLVASFALVGYGEPYMRYLYNLLMFDVNNGVIASGIGEGVFVKAGGYTIRVQESRGAGRKLYGVFVARQTPDGRYETYTAKQGELSNVSDNIVLHLLEGEYTDWSIDPPSKKIVQFSETTLPFDLSTQFRGRGGVEQELTLTELARIYWLGLHADWDAGGLTLPDGVPPDAKSVHFAAIASEFNERMAYVLSILLMPFFAAPLGITSPRSPRFAGPSVGLVGIFAYQKVLEAFGKTSGAGRFPAEPTIWGTFIIFAVLTIILFRSTARSTGMTPLNTFEDAMADLTRAITLRLTGHRPQRKPETA